MLDQLRKVYVSKLEEELRYKKNLISVPDIERDLIILSCFYSVYTWVSESNWKEYSDKVNSLLHV